MSAQTKIQASPIAPVTSTNTDVALALQQLRTNVQTVITNLVSQLNQATVSTNLDVQGHRITNVSWPTSLYDAVPKIYVDRNKKNFVQQSTKGIGIGAYTIVFSNSGLVVDGDITPAFIVGSQRQGRPIEAWVYAEGAPTTNSLAVNINVNGTRILLTDLILASSGTSTATGPIFETTFQSLFPPLTHGAVVTGTFSAGGIAQGVSVGLVVRVT